jgi:hypothetical protein
MGVLEVTEMYLLETLSLFPGVDNTVHKEDINSGHIRQHLHIKKSTYGEVAQHRVCIYIIEFRHISTFCVKFLKMKNDSFTSHLKL